MTRARGFTLVEVLICVGLLAVLVYPVYSMVETTIGAYDDSLRQVNLLAELARTEAQIKRLTQVNSKYQINSDNRGLQWPDGTALVWKEAELLHRNTPLAKNVDHFALFERDGITIVSLGLRDPKTQRTEQLQFPLVEANNAPSRH
jgi:prepilin-type N-terminal cleavage/methylation domain-containing protein